MFWGNTMGGIPFGRNTVGGIPFGRIPWEIFHLGGIHNKKKNLLGYVTPPPLKKIGDIMEL